MSDWTVDPETGRANSSPLFRNLVAEVAEVIRSGAFSLLSGHAETVAGTIVANLAHVHGLSPKGLHVPTTQEDLLAIAESFKLKYAFDGTTAEECAQWKAAAEHLAHAANCMSVLDSIESTSCRSDGREAGEKGHPNG